MIDLLSHYRVETRNMKRDDNLSFPERADKHCVSEFFPYRSIRPLPPAFPFPLRAVSLILLSFFPLPLVPERSNLHGERINH